MSGLSCLRGVRLSKLINFHERPKILPRKRERFQRTGLRIERLRPEGKKGQGTQMGWSITLQFHYFFGEDSVR